MTTRIITGSLDNVLAAYDISFSPFTVTPVFREAAHILTITALAHEHRYLASGSKDENILLWDTKKLISLGELFHHQADITWLGFRKKYLISCDADGIIMITRVKDWEPVGRLKGKSRINFCSTHPSNTIALTVHKDKHLRLWNLMTGKRSAELNLHQEALAVEWSGDASTFAIMFQDKIDIYNLQCECIRTLSVGKKLHCMLYNERVYVGCEDGSVVIYDQEEKKVVELHDSRIKGLQIFNSHLITSSSKGEIAVYDLNESAVVGRYETNDRITCMIRVHEGS